ncbi:UvrD-helicase domain-containing protein [Corynebacterium sp. MC-04]|uniref:UvrD-helicase domain-containing protein n=1 Tax=Corynebacterium parakroppenstedtii TaxID=2828363 RepID=UPI001EF129F0|nr:UvrD-helicase domain-containing protein [Corynebacterium parakroppenstedtii]MCF6787391.1 UvrD-helicase domain-containing protein [Corynebacterium parakroppenstedtii]MCF6809466.1 UvrD-helicase domain-containing protein [Corynebacterium parakroppenstedtii]MCF6813435.1 UvrD-helicase domain-containing protein [Corynebacterium parakroppenstedtii]
MNDSLSTRLPDGGPLTPQQLLEGLNPQQRQAVEHEGSPLLVVAGAGSGKTAVLTRRIAYLIGVRGVAPWNIVAITFTNKAATEMKDRVADLIGPIAERMWVSTFHSMCVRILRAQANLIPGLNTNFTIYDSDDSRRLLTMIARDMNLDLKRFAARTVASAISNLKNELRTPEEALADAEEDKNPFNETVAQIFAEYQKRLRASNAVDFDDLIGEVVRIFREYPEVALYYRRRFRHVLVDEYQDTNHAQYVLVSTLVGDERSEGDAIPPSELCVVGDADQSIYAFRGATIRNIEEFERDYPHAETILLEQNYRSTQTILSVANAVISQNSGRREKNLWTALGEGERIVGYVADNEHDEARFVAREIDQLVDNSTINYGDIAVFYRTNNASRALEDIFIRNGLPYKVVGGTRFYERKEIRDIIAYLKVLDNPDDSVSLRRIINTPRRGIGNRALSLLSLYAEDHGVSMGAALRAAADGDIPALGSRGNKAVGRFVEMMGGLRDDITDNQLVSHDGDDLGIPDLGAIVNDVIERSGYLESLEGSNDPQDGARLDNLRELVSVAREFASEAAHQLAYERMPSSTASESAPGAGAEDASSVDSDGVGSGGTDSGGGIDTAGDEGFLEEGEPQPGSLQAFLERVSLVSDADQIPDEENGVITLMTLHTAKGLEFPVVFLTGWEDGQFPHMRALGDPSELSEERRLAYVGITRAQRRLYISRAVTRGSWGQPVNNPASRFIAEIPEDLIHWERKEPQQSWDSGDWSLGWPDKPTSGYRRGNSRYRGSQYGGAGSSAHGSGGRRGAGRGVGSSSDRRSGTPASALHLEVGDQVNHDKYGLGTVESVSGLGKHTSVVINFGKEGTVRLMLIGNVPMEKL